MDEIETAFQQTTALVLGTPLTNLPSYHAWLRQGQPAEVKEKPSALSGLPVYVASLDFFDKMGPRVITLEESLGHGQSMLELEQVRSLSLANATSTLSPISLTTPEIVYDKNIGTQESACYGPTQYCLGGVFHVVFQGDSLFLLGAHVREALWLRQCGGLPHEHPLLFLSEIGALL